MTYGGKGESSILLQGTGKVGIAVVSLHCTSDMNSTSDNTSQCPFSE